LAERNSYRKRKVTKKNSRRKKNDLPRKEVAIERKSWKKWGWFLGCLVVTALLG